MDIRINCQATGIEEMINKLEAMKNIERNPRLNQALGRGAARIQAAVKLLTPVKTGNLINKIITNNTQMNVWHVETNVEYAAFVEYGTGKLGDPAVPHTSKESWTYYSDELHRFVTTHGQKPVHMFTKGFASAHKAAFECVKREVKEIIINA